MRALVITFSALLLFSAASSATAGTIFHAHHDHDFDNFGDLVKHLAHQDSYDDCDLDGDHDLFDHHGPLYSLIQLVDAKHPGKHLGHYLHALHHLLAGLFKHHHGHHLCDDVVTTPPPVIPPPLPPLPPLPPPLPDNQLPGPGAEPAVDADVSVAPEPASLAIWAIGALGCAAYGYRRKQRAA